MKRPEQYFAADADREVEVVRLGLFEQLLDPLTLRRLSRLGVAPVGDVCSWAPDEDRSLGGSPNSSVQRVASLRQIGMFGFYRKRGQRPSRFVGTTSFVIRSKQITSIWCIVVAY